ncbi:MAG TPA: lytic transglycosylase domain-containing protein, partial [Myxococcaceae bacterium]|nr:lytic transglycosylase domain-containing protein [Myxococcaceae bacterium]
MTWLELALLSAVATSSAPTLGASTAEAKPPAAASVEAEGAAADVPDDPEIGERVDAESAELEEMRALEESAMRPAPKVDEGVLRAVRRLGVAHPTRQRLSDALEELEPGGDFALSELPRVTDLEALDMVRLRGRFDIPVEMQPLVAQYIQFFQGPGRKWFRKWMGRSTRYLPVMAPILESHQMPIDTVYLAMIESGFAPHAYSHAKAAGPWQFIPSTGKMYGLKEDFWVDERRDPLKSTGAAAKYLTQLRQEFGDWYLAWAGYNAGSGKVRRVMQKKGSTNFWELAEGKGFAKETQHYVPKLIACAIVAKNYKAFGFNDEEFEFLPALAYDEVKLTDATDLEVIAQSAGVTVDEVKELNPELKRWCTPPASEKLPYVLKLPAGSSAKFTEGFARIPARERLSFRVHRVK